MFTRTIVRCEVYPHQFRTQIQQITGIPLAFAKSAGVEFQFAFFKSAVPKVLEDISNVTSFALRIRQGAASGTLLMDSASEGASVTINASLSQDAWDAGTAQHLTIRFPSSLTTIAAGNHFLTLYGITSEDPAEFDVFGYTPVTVVDVGSLGVTDSPEPAEEYATLAQVLSTIDQRMAQYAKLYGDVGATQTWRGSDGTIAEIVVSGGQVTWNIST